MIVKYLKGNPNCNGDMYMKENDDMHLIVMSQDNFTSFANDEGGKIFGYYQNINMLPKEYDTLLGLANSQNREKGINLLNLIHSKNPNLKASKVFFQGEIPLGIKLDQYDLFLSFEKKDPILK